MRKVERSFLKKVDSSNLRMRELLHFSGFETDFEIRFLNQLFILFL
ncbi:hypothetical protein LEP1GSC060_3094 [Leptospira weilii serovar Ranarum str. ICFT]|uniref:Uncharacterized protein n=1 Tax=Leptospira weilii serovar Ranarum str. ICFT TaxID=1218598 RepID=N1WEG5_9LEPT|nr:hypothetical protein LEP1GSC060_3094 [Leptospira weilii serovar Ranarum str. ICFT]